LIGNLETFYLLAFFPKINYSVTKYQIFKKESKTFRTHMTYQACLDIIGVRPLFHTSLNGPQLKEGEAGKPGTSPPPALYVEVSCCQILAGFSSLFPGR
jgi:hypothetical protein